jgi:uncharacterized protein
MADAPFVTADRISAAPDIAGTREMTNEVCWRHLGQAAAGRVALIRGARPLVFPVNHVTDGHTIVFRTGATSPLALLASREPVTFEVDDDDPSRSTGWSVLLTGEIERVDSDARIELDPQPMPWAPGRIEAWIRIVPIRVTGLEVTRRRHHPDDLLPPNMASV